MVVRQIAREGDPAVPPRPSGADRPVLEDLPGAGPWESADEARPARESFEPGSPRPVRGCHPAPAPPLRTQTLFAVRSHAARMTRFTIDVQMRFRDIDGMGHVNNAVFLSYMDLARPHFYLTYATKRS